MFSVRLPVKSSLVFGEIRGYTWIFYCVGVSAPNPRPAVFGSCPHGVNCMHFMKPEEISQRVSVDREEGQELSARVSSIKLGEKRRCQQRRDREGG